MSTMVRKLFKHGGSYALDIPMAFVKHAGTTAVIIETTPDGLTIHPKTALDTIEAEPQFADFIAALAIDAMKHPEKLHDVKEVWNSEWDELLKGVSTNGE